MGNSLNRGAFGRHFAEGLGVVLLWFTECGWFSGNFCCMDFQIQMQAVDIFRIGWVRISCV